MIYRNVIGNASVPLFRTLAVREIGGYRTRAEQGGVQGCEDWDLTLRVAAKYLVDEVPDYLVGYRQIAVDNVVQCSRDGEVIRIHHERVETQLSADSKEDHGLVSGTLLQLSVAGRILAVETLIHFSDS